MLLLFTLLFELFVTVLLKPEDDWLAAIEELLNVKLLLEV
jgi:hypothetical protein